jgi:class 3 adenylate cyclase
MMIGVLGAEHFLKMGAVGDVVNIAARVQGLSRQCGHDVLITRETYGYVSSDIPATYCGAFTIAGYRQPIAIYGLGDAPDDCTPRGTPRCATPETHMSQHPATPHQISHRQELFP